MPFPQPAKDYIRFDWLKDFTLDQITQIRNAVAACKSQGLQVAPWNNPARAVVLSTKVNTTAQGQQVVDVNYWANIDGKESAIPIMQTVTITGF